MSINRFATMYASFIFFCLYKHLNKISCALTYISSYPSRNNPNEYIVIVTFDGHIHNNNLLNAIKNIKPKTSFFRYLGSYKRG